MLPLFGDVQTHEYFLTTASFPIHRVCAYTDGIMKTVLFHIRFPGVVSALVSVLFAACLVLVVPAGSAHAQSATRDIARTIDRLDNNPRYRGRILGTHLRDLRGRTVYEVRILRRDDSIVLVYIDPQTGGVVGDSERGAGQRNRRADRPGTGREPGFSHGFSAPRRQY